ncbi:hypothetical protein P7C70_g2942, partial [Phenoliferia sp. Uapishka_3]
MKPPNTFEAPFMTAWDFSPDEPPFVGVPGPKHQSWEPHLPQDPPSHQAQHLERRSRTERNDEDLEHTQRKW